MPLGPFSGGVGYGRNGYESIIGGGFWVWRYLKWRQVSFAVDFHDRKVQKKGTSGFFVAIPSPIAHALGIQKGRTVRFWSVNGKAVFKPVSADGLTKKDVADIDKYEEAVREIREELQAGAAGGRAGGGAVPDPPGGAEIRPAGPGPKTSGRRPPLSNAERLRKLSL